MGNTILNSVIIKLSPKKSKVNKYMMMMKDMDESFGNFIEQIV